MSDSDSGSLLGALLQSSLTPTPSPWDSIGSDLVNTPVVPHIRTTADAIANGIQHFFGNAMEGVGQRQDTENLYQAIGKNPLMQAYSSNVGPVANPTTYASQLGDANTYGQDSAPKGFTVQQGKTDLIQALLQKSIQDQQNMATFAQGLKNQASYSESLGAEKGKLDAQQLGLSGALGGTPNIGMPRTAALGTVSPSTPVVSDGNIGPVPNGQNFANALKTGLSDVDPTTGNDLTLPAQGTGALAKIYGAAIANPKVGDAALSEYDTALKAEKTKQTISQAYDEAKTAAINGSIQNSKNPLSSAMNPYSTAGTQFESARATIDGNLQNLAKSARVPDSIMKPMKEAWDPSAMAPVSRLDIQKQGLQQAIAGWSPPTPTLDKLGINPSADTGAQASAVTKTIGGTTYVKVNGGWQAQ